MGYDITTLLDLAAQNANDICEHVPMLYLLASLVPEGQRIVELGTRYGVSTMALGHGKRAGVRFDSVDINSPAGFATTLHVPHYRHWVRDSREAFGAADIGLLFVDTEHTEAQVAAELAAWIPLMVPDSLLVCHDTVTFPAVLQGVQRGLPLEHLRPPIYHSPRSNGLTVWRL